MPTALELALQWRAKREERLEEQKKVDAIEAEEKELKAKVMTALKKSKNRACSDGERLFQLIERPEPFVEDWAKLYTHIKKTGEFELLYRRVNAAAVKERWENDAVVPGVGSIPIQTLSDTEAK